MSSHPIVNYSRRNDFYKPGMQGQDGKTAMDLASDPQVQELLQEPAKAATF